MLQWRRSSKWQNAVNGRLQHVFFSPFHICDSLLQVCDEDGGDDNWMKKCRSGGVPADGKRQGQAANRQLQHFFTFATILFVFLVFFFLIVAFLYFTFIIWYTQVVTSLREGWLLQKP